MTTHRTSQRSVAGPYDALQLSYYHPWVYAGSERYHQLAIEELRMGRRHAYVYVSDAGAASVVDEAVRDELYTHFALYEHVSPGLAVPKSQFAAALTGPEPVSLTEVVETFAPAYVRAPFPTEHFVEALETPQFRAIPLIYDVIDLWTEFPTTPWGSDEVENYYVKRADALAMVSQELVDRFPAPSTHLVPNAVDRHFLQLIAPTPEFVRRAPGAPVRVLYMGSMGGKWFDWELVHRLVAELPDHEFTFLGSQLLPPEEMRDEASRKVARNYARLGEQPNVVLAPEVPHDRIVPWLQRMDVGLIPFRPTALTRSVSPLKVFEYLGAGAPVVQTGMPDIEHYPGVLTARDHESFVEHVRRADRANLSPAEASRIADFAERNTWAQRVADFDRIVDRLRRPSDHAGLTQKGQ
ncbi:glycosyltransferase family protein [Nocardia gipuzkoensis]|uniref:glycosyltransferase family protein n=1 Tax=Nocardia gipuzkoensis TaxID=2749991 RepID=UPI00237E6E38|nr:glycosyltransferase [Nocardia gipuzkoensis]MDE1670309.1 glycosyltransferase [Nocardia gipuzkoensis]